MRIQEMKSGFSHLKNRMEDPLTENYIEPSTAPGWPSKAELQQDMPQAIDCELDEPRWSVVSFEKTEGAGLTYNQAVSLLFELDARNVSGLCIVTDPAASNIRS